MGKIVWGLAITVCFVVCTIQIYNRVSTFLETPVEVQVDVVRNETIQFPAITICPIFPMDYSMAFYKLRLQYVQHFSLSNGSAEELRKMIPYAELLNLPHMNVTYLWNATRIGSVQVHALCSLIKTESCSDYEIRSKDLETIWGTCNSYTFMKDVTYDGTHSGYNIIFGDYENFPDAPLEWNTMILLHEKDDLPRHRIYLESGQTVYPNYETILAFSVQQYRHLNTPASPCRSQAEVQNCIFQCIEKHILSSGVTCRYPYIENNSLPHCTTPKDAYNTEKVTKQVYKKWARNKICMDCPRKCTENIYSVVQNVIAPCGNVTHLRVLLLDNTLDLVTESSAFPFGVLVSDIGGNLGLFLGVCILTGLQILEIIGIKIYRMIKIMR